MRRLGVLNTMRYAAVILGITIFGLVGCGTEWSSERTSGDTNADPIALRGSGGSVVTLVNQARAQNGTTDGARRALVPDPALDAAAKFYADWLAKNVGGITHYNDENGGPQDRADMFGYNGVASEVLALVRGWDDAVQAWLISPGHRAVLLGDQWVHMGTGARGKIHVLMFGYPDGTTSALLLQDE